MTETLPAVELVYALDSQMMDMLGRTIASLCRWGNHGWTEAMDLTLRELFWRFDSLQKLIKDENAALPSGPPNTKM